MSECTSCKGTGFTGYARTLDETCSCCLGTGETVVISQITPADFRRMAKFMRQMPGGIKLIPEELEEVASQIEQLQSDNAKMRECLEWYAEKDVWWMDAPGFIDSSVAENDGGERARECLSKLGSGSDE